MDKIQPRDGLTISDRLSFGGELHLENKNTVLYFYIYVCVFQIVGLKNMYGRYLLDVEFNSTSNGFIYFIFD